MVDHHPTYLGFITRLCWSELKNKKNEVSLYIIKQDLREKEEEEKNINIIHLNILAVKWQKKLYPNFNVTKNNKKMEENDKKVFYSSLKHPAQDHLLKASSFISTWRLQSNFKAREVETIKSFSFFSLSWPQWFFRHKQQSRKHLVL